MSKREKSPAKADSHGIPNPRRVIRGGMPRTLGVRLVSVSAKRVIAKMPIKPLHLNRSGHVSGGAIMAFADAVGATGTVANLPPGHRTSTLDSKTNFFAAGLGPVVSAVSIPLHIGRTTMVWQTTIRNSDRRLVAIVTQTQIVIPAKSDAPPAPKKTPSVRRSGKLKQHARRSIASRHAA